jgi:hypothetical protein
MTSIDGITRRLDRLETDQAATPSGVVVIYEPGETEEETRARVPPGARTVIYLPNNHRDDRPEAP